MNIRKARKKAKMTQADLADAAGISQSHLSRVERGMQYMSLPVLIKVAAALKTELSTLLDR